MCIIYHSVKGSSCIVNGDNLFLRGRANFDPVVSKPLEQSTNNLAIDYFEDICPCAKFDENRFIMDSVSIREICNDFVTCIE